MLVFSVRNTVLVALVQVAIVVIGVLASGLYHKWVETVNVPLPQTTVFLMQYGAGLLIIPVVWIAVVSRVRLSLWSDEAKSFAYLSGFLLIGGLLILIAHGIVTPWVRHHFEQLDRVPEEARLESKTAIHPGIREVLTKTRFCAYAPALTSGGKI